MVLTNRKGGVKLIKNSGSQHNEFGKSQALPWEGGLRVGEGGIPKGKKDLNKYPLLTIGKTGKNPCT